MPPVAPELEEPDNPTEVLPLVPPAAPVLSEDMPPEVDDDPLGPPLALEPLIPPAPLDPPEPLIPLEPLVPPEPLIPLEPDPREPVLLLLLLLPPAPLEPALLVAWSMLLCPPPVALLPPPLPSPPVLPLVPPGGTMPLLELDDPDPLAEDPDVPRLFVELLASSAPEPLELDERGWPAPDAPLLTSMRELAVRAPSEMSPGTTRKLASLNATWLDLKSKSW